MDKILIIEDEPTLGDLLVRKLQSAGYTVDLMRDGVAGLAALRSTKYDLLILDVFLPLMNGLELLGQKRADATIASVPVIMLTNSLHPVEGTELEAMGVAQFWVKADLTPEQVLTQVRGVLTKEVSAETQSAPIQKDALAKTKVLLVEDDEFLGKILSTRLSAEHTDVMYAKSGEDALEQLKTGVPQVALLDILLPGINGFEVLTHIRADERMKDIPVIMISNFNQDSDKEKAYSLGATYLVKAMVNPDDIVAEIFKVMKPAETPVAAPAA